MSLSQNQKDIIKKLQKVVLENIVNCSDDVRKNAMNQFRNVKFEIVSEIDLMEMSESASVAAFFDEDKNLIVINSAFANDKFFEHLLLHEMFHAYSFNNGRTGFYCLDSVKYNKRSASKEHNCSVTTKMFEMLNESATEFYATMFSDKRMMSYTFFTPIYSNLSEVCGFDKLENLYFSNNTAELIKTISNTFHLKDDILVNKLLMQMDQCFNNETGATNKQLIPYMYKTFIDMHIRKAIIENGKRLTISKLKKIIDIDKIVKSVGLIRYEDIFEFDKLKKELIDYVANYNFIKHDCNFSKLKNKMDNFMLDRLLSNRTANFAEYKDYFSKHLLDCILYLGQNNVYKIDSYQLNPDLQINEFLNFMHDENRHINLSNLTKDEKDLFIKTVMDNKKYKIVNPEKHFYEYDLNNATVNK